MKQYTLPSYNIVRNAIKHLRTQQIEWDKIKIASWLVDTDLETYLRMQMNNSKWPDLSTEDWYNLVDLEHNAENKTRNIDVLYRDAAMIYSPDQVSELFVPSDDFSCWQLYRKRLIDIGFKCETVSEIEKASIKILQRLRKDTSKTGPVKGLVIGNVQSGKTANMAALMAMAADWGWNMFIILSGTIESLRNQTQKRLFSDLYIEGNINWNVIEHPSKNVSVHQTIKMLHFGGRSTNRYFTVCLKNSKRLRNLIEWLKSDTNKLKQMNILVIDDEADQAGVNTGNIDENERKTINRLICTLVNGKDSKHEYPDLEYGAMNYIGYTATPYANILNEASKESLYPRNFICTLAVSNEYFGPQQIFGYKSDDKVEFEGLEIIRKINDSELADLKSIHSGDSCKTPDSLIDSLAWFLCGLSCMRIWGYDKPVSMLVHTSQKTDHHDRIADVICEWFKNDDSEILERCRNVWGEETKKFTIEKLREAYPNYGRPDSEINDYPLFADVEKEIRNILNNGVSSIKLNEKGDLTYNEGIHLCIDNCTNNGITDEGDHVRLAYPEPENMPQVAPGFIVIGGQTLSRGLTIEGLISTFFIRSVGQADTLMQMGRWFGYRKNYELLPRIWITERTEKQFKYLAELDQELRDEINYMFLTNRQPSDYGPKVKNSPKASLIRITAKNKMQSATEASMDYTGASCQTYLFDNDLETLNSNISVTNEFINNLGEAWVPECSNRFNKNTVIWKNISFEKIRKYIEKFQFQKRLSVFNDTKPLLDWISNMTKEGKLGTWNVIAAGKSDGDKEHGIWHLPNGKELYKVSRSKFSPKSELDKSLIDIGVLRDPSDLLADVVVSSIADSKDRQDVENFMNSGSLKNAPAYRDKAGLDTTPQLLIYCVDKKSTAKKNTKTNREDLNACADLIGMNIYIPGGKKGTSYVSTVSINMSDSVFNGDADLEDVDEDEN